MTQLVWSYLREYYEEREEILDAVDTVFRSGQLVLGESVRGFEQEFARYHGRGECVGVDNGTNALVLGLRALGVGPGDEVITVANTAAPTVVAIDAVGATPVFVDIDEKTYLMDLGQLDGAMTERTRCLLPVHLYGQCVDMGTLVPFAERHGLPVLEDCAQSHGARQHGELAGTLGTAAAYSFYPTKVLGAFGDAGAVTTDDPEVAATVRRMRYYGMTDRYHVVATPAYNSRLDEVQAEILRRRLTRLDRYIACRQAIARRYEVALAGTELVLPAVAGGNTHVYYLYVVRHPRRDLILDQLRAKDISLTVSYRWPAHRQEGFAHLGYRDGDLPVTEAVADEIFSLPMYPSLTRGEQDRVIDALLTVLETC